MCPKYLISVQILWSDVHYKSIFDPIVDNHGKYTSLIKICLFTMANTFIQDSFLAKLELIDILFTALVNDQDETIMQWVLYLRFDQIYYFPC